MAIIQTIRDKYAKLAGGVIVLALVGFVLMDYGKGGGSSRNTTIGEINGKDIDYTQYDAAVQQREAEMKRQNPNGNLDEATQAQTRDQVWAQLVNDELMKEINEKLGIVVTKSELNDMLTGANPDPTVKQAFTNPQTGVFNPQEVASTIAQLKKDPERKADWAAFEANLLKTRYASKLNTLISGSVYMPKFMLDDQNATRGAMASIKYVKLPFTLIPDDKVKVTDEEIKKYMEERKVMFQVKESSRGVEFVAFNIAPSQEDSSTTFSELEKLKTEFTAATDNEAFVIRNSATQIPTNYFTRAQLQSLPNVDELMSASVGSVVGPFFDGQNYMLAKIEDKKVLPDSVHVRHILVKTADKGVPKMTDVLAKARLDSAVAMLKGGAPFDSLVVRYSDDFNPQSPNTKGDYEFTLAQKATISKEFGDFAFEGATGSNKIVKVENEMYAGYHYIEILKQSAGLSVSKIAFLSKELNISETTNDAIYAKATEFASKATNGANFDKNAKIQGLIPSPAEGLNENSYVVNGLGASRDLVKWAYEAKLNDVSPIFTIGDKHVIAKLKNIMPAGLAPINAQTRPILENYVRKYKKAKMLIDRTKGKTNLEAIAQSEMQTVANADSVNFLQGFVPGVGNEPKVAGYTFNKTFKENTVSPAIAGNDGVYYISVNSRAVAPANTERNIVIERQMMEANVKANAASQVINGIKESADVKDERGKLY